MRFITALRQINESLVIHSFDIIDFRKRDLILFFLLCGFNSALMELNKTDNLFYPGIAPVASNLNIFSFLAQYLFDLNLHYYQ